MAPLQLWGSLHVISLIGSGVALVRHGEGL